MKPNRDICWLCNREFVGRPSDDTVGMAEFNRRWDVYGTVFCGGLFAAGRKNTDTILRVEGTLPRECLFGAEQVVSGEKP